MTRGANVFIAAKQEDRPTTSPGSADIPHVGTTLAAAMRTVLKSHSFRSRRSREGGTVVVTLRDVARAAGVSPATASRALSAPDLVAPARREHVQQVARDLGYRPNRAAPRADHRPDRQPVPRGARPREPVLRRRRQRRPGARPRPRLRPARRGRRGGSPPRERARRAPRRPGGRRHPLLPPDDRRRARPAQPGRARRRRPPAAGQPAARRPAVRRHRQRRRHPPGRDPPVRARAPPDRVRRRPGGLVVRCPAAARARARVARPAQHRRGRPRALPSPVRRRRGRR